MSLKITLKNNERLIVGGAVVRNGGKGTVLFIDNTVPILREKDILGEQDANTPCKRAYFIIQLMYIDEPNVLQYRSAYAEMARDIVKAAPSTAHYIEQINERIEAGNYYHALKSARNLIDYEEELLKIHTNNAIREYVGIQKESMPGRELVAYVLTKAALMLKACQESWDAPDRESKLLDRIKFNQKVWSFFLAELSEANNPMPTKLREDILNLSLFLDKRLFEVMALHDIGLSTQTMREFEKCLTEVEPLSPEEV